MRIQSLHGEVGCSLLVRGIVFLIAMISAGCDSGDARNAADGNRSSNERAVSATPGADTIDLGPLELSETDRARLEALGYMIATEPAPQGGGVVRHQSTSAQPGLNLIVSQHAQRAELRDMDGKIVHVWEGTPASSKETWKWWRTVHLYSNGDLLAQVDFGPLVKLDANSNLLWEFGEVTHHDVDVADDGTIYVLTTLRPRPMPFFRRNGNVGEEFIVHLDADGNVLRRVSILQALLRGRYPGLIQRLRKVPSGQDLLHTNSVKVLDGSLALAIPAFRRGNVLISVPRIDTILVVDFETRTVVWSLQGSFRFQHDATMLPNGHMLLFDNRGTPGQSAVLEIDPLTEEEWWVYRGTDDAPFFSNRCGRAHRLANGNTLIVESQPGRAFEVTSKKEIVWEFVNPYRFRDKIAVLNDVVRLPADFPHQWAHDASDESRNATR